MVLGGIAERNDQQHAFRRRNAERFLQPFLVEPAQNARPKSFALGCQHNMGGSNADAAKGVDNNTVEWINDMYGEDSGLIRKPEVKRVTLKEILENAQLFDTMEREPAYKRMER